MVWTWNIKKLKSLFKRVGSWDVWRCRKYGKERDDFENKLADLSNEKELLVEQIASKEFEIENLQEKLI
jgi:predicted nuclease with TOPRIM domain